MKILTFTLNLKVLFYLNAFFGILGAILREILGIHLDIFMRQIIKNNISFEG